MSSPELQHILDQSGEAIRKATTLADLEELRIRYLGKQGVIPEKMRQLGALPPEERKTFGQAVNLLKEAITTQLEETKAILETAEMEKRLSLEQVDISLSVRPESRGTTHPIPQVIEEITTIFASLGFTVAEGPEIEDDFHNFTALNIPPGHPARQMQDTFYLPPAAAGDAPRVLRTHTSPVQIRAMENGTPPFRLIAPGRVYRSDYDMTHTPMFHQVEGLCIDKNITMAHLKGCLEAFLKAFFEVDAVPVRLRPSFFPFTEPSAEVDIGCSRKGGTFRIDAGEDWLEVLGCGMVHPTVLKNAGVNPDEWQGFAFGLGVERLAMLKYGVPDLRQFFESDVRWLKHYGFGAFNAPTQAGGL